MAQKFTEKEMIPAAAVMHIYVLGAMIEQGVLDRSRLTAFFQRHLDERVAQGYDDATNFLLQRTLKFLDPAEPGQWTLQ